MIIVKLLNCNTVNAFVLFVGILLVNLALADLVTGCFSTPFRFQMVLFQHWAYGEGFCSFSCFVDNCSLFARYHQSGGRGRGLRTLFLFRVSTPCRTKESPFVLFWDIHFWLTDPKNFFGVKIFYIWEVSARRKNAIFWSTFSKKCLKTLFWPFLKFRLRSRKL